MLNSDLLSTVIIVAPTHEIPPERRLNLTTLDAPNLVNLHRNTSIAWYRHARSEDTSLVLSQVEGGLRALANELIRRLKGQPYRSTGGLNSTTMAQTRSQSIDPRQSSPAASARPNTSQQSRPSRPRYRGMEM